MSSCNIPGRLYESRRVWEGHIKQDHRNTPFNFRCPLCQEGRLEHNISHHIARHLQDVALFVLPPSSSDERVSDTQTDVAGTETELSIEQEDQPASQIAAASAIHKKLVGEGKSHQTTSKLSKAERELMSTHQETIAMQEREHARLAKVKETESEALGTHRKDEEEVLSVVENLGAEILVEPLEPFPANDEDVQEMQRQEMEIREGQLMLEEEALDSSFEALPGLAAIQSMEEKAEAARQNMVEKQNLELEGKIALQESDREIDRIMVEEAQGKDRLPNHGMRQEDEVRIRSQGEKHITHHKTMTRLDEDDAYAPLRPKLFGRTTRYNRKDDSVEYLIEGRRSRTYHAAKDIYTLPDNNELVEGKYLSEPPGSEHQLTEHDDDELKRMTEELTQMLAKERKDRIEAERTSTIAGEKANRLEADLAHEQRQRSLEERERAAAQRERAAAQRELRLREEEEHRSRVESRPSVVIHNPRIYHTSVTDHVDTKTALGRAMVDARRIEERRAKPAIDAPSDGEKSPE
ncbi:hypothetical protein LTR84_006420 [Exophiala bonariae]|uniref:C2H2-type domain-containing protein n=1 Tax=Exophiala bonariae TaxID=1690606 RepID=A0AAV9N4C2_9EURO|nr:hypothetical protein LTR84_006420 [Exophiala bonariae]